LRDSEALPESWDCTSDSLAAWAARRLGAETLVLVKSVGDSTTPIEKAEELGWVDPCFVKTAAGLRIEWINAENISSSNISVEGGLR
jgi:5-(aminomethyl)-3-furanmethanol phosphate kinase